MIPLSRMALQDTVRRVLLILAALLLVAPTQAQGASGFSLRFYGNGVNDIDRVKIALMPNRPIDVGGDLTLEFWLKANAGENVSPACTPGGDNWINGNSILDRDIYGGGDFGDYGVSLYGGRIAFGVYNGTSGTTICGLTQVANSAWRHIAVTRSSSGALRVYVDGVLDGQGSGPAGDISYRDGRTTSWPNDPFLVIGAEKHDIDRVAYPSFSGWLDDLRVSNVVRYNANFVRPSAPHALDAATVALYRFDEGNGDVIADTDGGASPGVRRFGGQPAGAAWSSDTPFINLPTSVNLIFDGAFDFGFTNWAVFGGIYAQFAGGIFEIARWPGSGDTGFFQFNPYSAPAGATFELTFQVGNRGATFRTLNLVVGNADWSDVRNCFLTIPAGWPLATTYTMRLRALQPWPNIVLRGYVLQANGDPAIRLDNLNLRYLAGLNVVNNVECPTIASEALPNDADTK